MDSKIQPLHDSIEDILVETAMDVAAGTANCFTAATLGAIGGQMLAEHFANNTLDGMFSGNLGAMWSYVGGAAGGLIAVGVLECVSRATLSNRRSSRNTQPQLEQPHFSQQTLVPPDVALTLNHIVGDQHQSTLLHQSRKTDRRD